MKKNNRKDNINRVWTNLFVKISQAQQSAFDKSSKTFKKL